MKLKAQVTSAEISNYLKQLFPINRSITGNGNRETLNILSQIISLQTYECATGTKVFDWVIPEEWNVADAWIKDSSGKKLVDFSNSNLHIVNYSTPVHTWLKLDQLSQHLHYFVEQPEVIPYRTTYYNKNWGFCLSYKDFQQLFKENEEYEVYIGSELKNGSLSFADYKLNGSSGKEYMFSTYICHPSLANDNLSGFLLTALLARELTGVLLKNSYRFVFVPETIGAITYCAMNKDAVKSLSGAFEVTCVAGKGKYGYKESFEKDHLIDRAIRLTFIEEGIEFNQYPFIPQGSDERQYSSPGFRIPTASIHKDKYHEYKEYHTSADNLEFISAEHLLRTLNLYLSVINKLESDTAFLSLNPYCEPQLGKRNLYPTAGRRTTNFNKTERSSQNELDIILWILFYADGKHTYMELAEKLSVDFQRIVDIAEKLKQEGLIQ